MPWTDPSPVNALTGECERVADVVLALDEGAFSLPTRCPPWDVKALLGHLYRDVDRILQYRDEPAGRPNTTAVSYWRSYDRVGDAPAIAARAVEIADVHPTGRALARAFDARWREAVAAALEMSPDRPYRTFRPTLRLDEFVKTRVLELAVHGLDLADSLGREPWITPGSVEVVRAILIGLLEDDLPAELDWDDVTFIEAGTGRRRLLGTERATLGERADRFPLLS
ncbi:MAG: maleylpyruvate isomerase N-terminal domain-containing protein [Actinomycetota bacterium]